MQNNLEDLFHLICWLECWSYCRNVAPEAFSLCLFCRGLGGDFPSGLNQDTSMTPPWIEPFLHVIWWFAERRKNRLATNNFAIEESDGNEVWCDWLMWTHGDIFMYQHCVLDEMNNHCTFPSLLSHTTNFFAFTNIMEVQFPTTLYTSIFWSNIYVSMAKQTFLQSKFS